MKTRLLTSLKSRSRFTVASVLALLWAGACADPATSLEGEHGEHTGTVAQSFSVGEVEPNDAVSIADSIKANDVGTGSTSKAFDVDFWQVLVRPDDRLYMTAVPKGNNGKDVRMFAYTNKDTNSAFASDDDSGQALGAALAGHVIPSGVSTVFYQIETVGAAVDKYDVYSYTGNPSYAHVEPANENNDTKNTAEPVTAPLIRGEMSSATDKDHYSFVTNTFSTVVAIADKDPDSNGNLSLKMTIECQGSATTDVFPSTTNAEALVTGSGFSTQCTLLVEGGGAGKYDIVLLVDGKPVVPATTLPELSGNGSASTAVALKDRHAGVGAIDVAGDIDYWKIVHKSGDHLFAYVDTQQTKGSTDSKLELRSTTDGLVAQDDDSGPGASSALTRSLGDTSSFLRVAGPNNGTIGDYHLFAAAVNSADQLIDSEGNDTIGNSSAITQGMVLGKFPSPGDVDYWRFGARAGDTVVAIVDDAPSGGAQVDTDIEIRDDSDKVLATGDNNDGQKSNAVGPVLIPKTGYYHVRVKEGGSSLGDYRLVVLTSKGPITCGDGDLDGNEGCDDGNTNDKDGCSNQCAVETGWDCMDQPSKCKPICGDGLILGDEKCDDKNIMDGDGCSKSCALEDGWDCMGTPSMCAAKCGDGKIVGKEGCDDGNAVDGDGCDKVCKIEDGWTCPGTAPSKCVETCGDGKIVGKEACDDGNAMDGDGCDKICAIEAGWACSGKASSKCVETCGDGKIVGTEACDDGNAATNDGCDAACKPEDGFKCSGSPSKCEPVCGDGKKAGKEQCDDGNTNDGDGCSAKCETVAPPGTSSAQAGGGVSSKSGCSVASGQSGRGARTLGALALAALAAMRRRRRCDVDARRRR